MKMGPGRRADRVFPAHRLNEPPTRLSAVIDCRRRRCIRVVAAVAVVVAVHTHTQRLSAAACLTRVAAKIGRGRCAALRLASATAAVTTTTTTTLSRLVALARRNLSPTHPSTHPPIRRRRGT